MDCGRGPVLMPLLLCYLCSRVVERYNVSRCVQQLSAGIYFVGLSGYALLDDSRRSMTPSFSLSTDFTITVVFRTAALDALLVAAWQSQRCFAFLGLVNGQVL